MDKDVIHIYNGILVIKKNETLPFAATWMDLEIITLNELSQEEKDRIRKLWYIYTMEYYAAIKKNSLFESILMRWMKLEPIIQSEVSQKDKDHYNILTHIYGI